MPFNLAEYPEDVARLLEAHGAGLRPMPLVAQGCASQQASETLRQWKSATLFPQACSPLGALAGLWLCFSCTDEAHWFRRLGKHPVFPALRDEAKRLGYETGPQWEPLKFIDYCEAARQHSGSKEEGLAMWVQLVEWQLLFDYCIRENTR